MYQTVPIMVQLVTAKEKYGVSVSAWIAAELARKISDWVERLGVSMSKMVGMLISNGFNLTQVTRQPTLNPVQTAKSLSIERLFWFYTFRF
jgi:hypothetical protein